MFCCTEAFSLVQFHLLILAATISSMTEVPFLSLKQINKQLKTNIYVAIYPGWHQTHGNPSVSISQVLELWACATSYFK